MSPHAGMRESLEAFHNATLYDQSNVAEGEDDDDDGDETNQDLSPSSPALPIPVSTLTFHQIAQIQSCQIPSDIKAIERAIQDTIDPLSDPRITCSICLTPYHTALDNKDIREYPVTIPCGHIFGNYCLSKWLQSARGFMLRTCPICRFVVDFRRCPHYMKEQPAYAKSTPAPLKQRLDVCFSCYYNQRNKLLETEYRAGWLTLLSLRQGMINRFDYNHSPLVRLDAWPRMRIEPVAQEDIDMISGLIGYLDNLHVSATQELENIKSMLEYSILGRRGDWRMSNAVGELRHQNWLSE